MPLHELKYAFRALVKSPGFTAAAAVALALGIGANGAIFSVVNAVFLRPLPFPEPQNLVEMAESRGGLGSVSYPDYLDWRKSADSFTHMAATMVADATLELSGAAERIPVGYVGADFFRVFRTPLVLGRDFRSEDDTKGAAPVAILTHAVWQSRFGADPAILGRAVSINRTAYTVIGVLPPGFRFYRTADIFVPISNAIDAFVLYRRDNHNNVYVVARLAPGAAIQKAQAQMSTIARALEQAYPASNSGLGVRVMPLRDRLAGESGRPVFLLLGAVCLVLLIACVNVANLLLARSAGRRHEMGIRAALGASRWQVLRQLLLESLLLALAGGAIGMVLARWSFAGLIHLVPASLAPAGLTIDWRVFAFTLAVSLLTGVLFGFAPALDALHLSPSSAMREGGRATPGSARGRLRDALVVSEIALALVLLVGAGLLLRTLGRLVNVRLGFETENLLTAQVSLPDSDATTPEQAALFIERLEERVRNLPGVKSAGYIDHLPLSGFFSGAAFYRDDRPVPAHGDSPSADTRIASPEYFRTMGIPLRQGRLFTAADGRITNFRRAQVIEWFLKSEFRVVINESMARRFWPGENPVGKSFRFGFPEMHGPRLTILGVVGDTRDYGPDREAPPTFFFSVYHAPFRSLTLSARTHGDPSALTSAVRRAVAELEPGAVLTGVTTAEQIVASSFAPRRLNLLLLAIFAGLALVLASVGIYGVMSYAINLRRHEIGVRIALGATRADIFRLVLGRAALLGALGIAIGCVAAAALTRFMAGMLYGVQATDPATFAAVALALFTVAIAAGFAPARRATRISPIATLRCE
jgi:putative ABC transport system permease protein